MRLGRALCGGIFLILVDPAMALGPSGSTQAFPWTSYEAEDAHTNASRAGPSRVFLTPEVEASGRRFVRLSETGDFVEFTATESANTLVLRFSLPDAPKGGGRDATLSLFINGEPTKPLALTSRYAWIYGDFPWSNDPAEGRAHHFFDEAHTFIPAVQAGDKLRLEKGSGDTAEFYLIDFIELEAVGPPKAPPADALSIIDFGAVANDDKDDSQAFLACIEAAKASNRIVWLPPGNFHLNGSRIQLGGVRIHGAGMWYTRLRGSAPMFEGTGEPIEVRDLGIFGAISHRDDASPDNAFNGNFGTGSHFSHLWIEHVKCGFWTTHGTRRLTLSHSRVRNVMADGLNFCDGTSHSTVEYSHFRNTGDDALASWSPSGDWSSKTACVGNRFLYNRIQQPWLANGIALYGGKDHRIEGNDIRETVQSGAGIHLSSGFGAVPFSGTIVVRDNRIHGAGNDAYIGDTVGGLWLHAKDSVIEAKILIEDLAIEDSLYSAVTIHGPHSFQQLTLADLRIRGAGEHGIHVKSGAKGQLTIQRIQIAETAEAPLQNDGSAGFTIKYPSE
jgi:hypothetical protein